MKRLIIFSLCQLLILVFPSSGVFAQGAPPDTVRVERTYAEGVKDGKEFAHDHYASGRWFWGGFAGGFLFYGPIGTGVMAGVSQLATAQLPESERFRIQEESPPYREGFQKGYAQRANSKALGRSLLGGATGTVVLLGVVAILFATGSS